MRRSSQTTSSSFWKHTVPTAAFVCTMLLGSKPLIGQKPQDTTPKYDVHTEAKMKGTVDDVKTPPKGNEKEAVHLMVKSGAETIDVYLCPQSFLDDMGATFSKGDEISMTGSKVKQGDADLVLAREVVKGNDALVLRDDKGNPIWSWHH